MLFKPDIPGPLPPPPNCMTGLGPVGWGGGGGAFGRGGPLGAEDDPGPALCGKVPMQL